MKGVDSAARFSAAAAKAAGYDVGARYINQTFTRAELDDYNANGLILLPIYEESGKPGSYADGQRQGANALRLLTALGIPTYGCAFTDDVSGASYAVVREWVRGIKSTFPNHLVYYGPADKGDQLCDEGLADSVWIEGAFSYSRPYVPGQAPTARHACGIQYPPPYAVIGGVTCDRNDFYSTPWLPGAQPPPPEDDVTLEELQQELSNQDARTKAYIDAKIADVLQQLDGHDNGNGPTLRDVCDRIYNATGAKP